MPHAKKAPRTGDKLGTGTATKGRLSDALPNPDNRVVGKAEPPYDVVGVDALSPLLEHVDFPATKADLMARIGQFMIPVTRHHTMPVWEVIDDTAPETFQSSAEVEQAVERVWSQIVSGGVRGGKGPKQGREYLGERPRND